MQVPAVSTGGIPVALAHHGLRRHHLAGTPGRLLDHRRGRSRWTERLLNMDVIDRSDSAPKAWPTRLRRR